MAIIYIMTEKQALISYTHTFNLEEWKNHNVSFVKFLDLLLTNFVDRVASKPL